MKHKHPENKEHDHNHGGLFGEKTELYFAILSGVFFFIGLFLEEFTEVSAWISLTSYIIAYFFGGHFTILEALDKIKKGEFEIDFLMIVAAIGAAYIGSWKEGALLLFLFSLGHSLEHYALNKAKKSIKALGELSPKTAFIKQKNGVKEVAIEALNLNDIVIVKPNTKIPADGVIVKGNSSINQASITGESIPVDKIAISSTDNISDFDGIDKNHVVYTGTINGDTIIEIQVLKLSKDSTISRLIKMVSEIDTKKSPTQRITKKFEKWFVPIVIVLVFILCFAHLVIDETLKQSLYRAISVLVAASPCALAISTPSAVLSGIARAAKSGVLIKGGRALEDLGSLTTIAFDKTGTLTEGTPKLTNAISLNGFDQNSFLALVVDVENQSNHPLAKSISNGIRNKYGITNKNITSDIKAIQGKGIEAIYDHSKVFIGNVKLMMDQNITVPNTINTQVNDLLKNGHTVMLVALKNELIGLLSVMDTPRQNAKSTLKQLQQIGIQNMIMLTGDHQNVGNAIAKQIGLTEAKGDLLPEDKITAIQELKRQDIKIAMVGDGVNDAPAMAYSTVGIAMGAAGSDIALETADVALMSDKIEKLPFVIGLSRKSKAIIKQNLWMSMGIVALLIPATLFEFANIGVAVAIHEGSTLMVVINALRLLNYGDK
ncbi:heavy metal translocating P-type ATPase [Aquimarina sp. 2201CG5-10]|uniref:heavy metal translocating P-type ATPase n=1 Tax=Aquimarina callyspongiae TaxID=3098150 RepID=UPI002AB54F09|nr:heavy metal translocating P-type ATPase [Aquimarina sp. 2201CG5-10]MDY8134622.1 heavy metal translocating P-type ATPase [Aquimarina sp. 2201CG5-10]